MKKILVGVDGSAREGAVVDAAAGLARRTGAKLVLFRAIGIPTELPAEAYALPPSEVQAFLERRAREATQALAAKLPPELVAGVRVHVGAPWQQIDKTAREEDVDLIVIGSHGYDSFDRVLGTTAAKVVNHADRSVLVVRAPERLA
jgi:nucleotide-binding universal stress UspA family protein